MSPDVGRWLTPAGASAAVLAVFVVPGLVAGASGSSAGGPPEDSVPGLLIPRDPVTPSLPPDQVDAPRTGERDVDLTGYRATGAQLTVFYTVDQSRDCSTRLGPVELREGVGSVVVTLTRRPSGDPGVNCDGLRLAMSVNIRLQEPLGGRLVQDGARGGSLVPRARPFGSAAAVVTPPPSRAGR